MLILPKIKTKMNDLFYAIGQAVEKSFVMFLEPLGNSFNYAVIALGFVGLIIWLSMQAKFTKKAKENGDIV